MLDVVAFLIEHFADLGACPMLEDLGEMLEDEGFAEDDIGRTLMFMHLLGEMPDIAPSTTQAMRVYNADELDIVPTEIRGFLHHLSAENVINMAQREYIIHALMHLPHDEIALPIAKTLTVLVLWAQRCEVSELIGDDLMGIFYGDNVMH